MNVLKDDLPEKVDECVFAREMKEEVFINSKVSSFIDNLDADHLSLVDRQGGIDVDDCLERNTDIDALALILSSKDFLAERVDPSVPVQFGVDLENKTPIRCDHLEAIGVLEGCFHRGDFSKVDMTLWKVGVPLAIKPAQETAFEGSPVLAESLGAAGKLGNVPRAKETILARGHVGVEAEVTRSQVNVTLEQDGAEHPALMGGDQSLICF